MKYLLLILLLTTTLIGQINFGYGIGLELSDSEDYEIRESMYDGIAYRQAVGHLSGTTFLTQLRADYKKFRIIADTKIYATLNNGWFNPTVALFDSEFQYLVNDKIKIGLAHRCIHPLLTVDSRTDLIYGGYDFKLKLHYNIH